MSKTKLNPVERKILRLAQVGGIFSVLLTLVSAWIAGIWRTTAFFSLSTFALIIVSFGATVVLIIIGGSRIEDLFCVLIVGILCLMSWRGIGDKIPLLKAVSLSTFIGICLGAFFNGFISPSRRKWEQETLPTDSEEAK